MFFLWLLVYVVILDELPPLAAASMWTRKDIKEFKESLHKDKDSVIKIGSGETVTVSIRCYGDGDVALLYPPQMIRYVLHFKLFSICQ
jgi:hypothetical protein